jgi:hypothetical protein
MSKTALELVEDKVNEIFEELQKDNNITSGDIAPLDALELDEAKEKLADIINRVIDFEISLKS